MPDFYVYLALSMLTAMILSSEPLNKKKSAGSIYRTEAAIFINIFSRRNLKIPPGWRQIDLNGDGVPDFYINPLKGFEGAAFKSDKEIIIAIRGMKFPEKSLYKNKIPPIFSGIEGKNALSILFGNLNLPFIKPIPPQFYDAEKFYFLIRNKYPECSIIFAGKSLGGALAQLLGAIYGHETYSFAAPGIKYALLKLMPEFRHEKNHSIKNICNLNDPLGNFGEHIGKNYVCMPRKIKNQLLFDIHGDTSHFADETLEIIPKPVNWKMRYTLEIICRERNLKQDRLIKLIKYYLRLRRGFKQKESH